VFDMLKFKSMDVAVDSAVSDTRLELKESNAICFQSGVVQRIRHLLFLAK
jgi:hypothetical protein